MQYTAQIRCTECGCTPEDCKKSVSPRDCKNCGIDYCCCWSLVHKKK